MKYVIIEMRDGWEGFNYDLQTESFRTRIYRSESSLPYILLDGERLNLLPDMRKELKKE